VTTIEWLVDSGFDDFADERQRARAKARELGRITPWVADVLAHHDAIEAALDVVAGSADIAGRRAAVRRLSLLSTAHGQAEEIVLYRAMALLGQPMHTLVGVADHARLRATMAALEAADDLGGADAVEMLGEIRGEMLRHMFIEERDWFPAFCRDGDAKLHARLSTLFATEFQLALGAALP